MIPIQTQRSVETSPTVASASFGISQNDVAHILTMLRDTLYSDRVLAVLREYAANAWDVHREVGRGDVPIQVTLPTLEAPTLEIRDFGTGISREDMLGRFLMAGASTKRKASQSSAARVHTGIRQHGLPSQAKSRAGLFRSRSGLSYRRTASAKG